MYERGVGQVRSEGWGRDLVLLQGDVERCITIVGSVFVLFLSFAIN